MSEKTVQLNEGVIKGQIKEPVRDSVEETLNGLLDAAAEQLTQAAKYERSEARQGYRSGHYSRSLTTTSGDVQLNIPKLKGIPFETAIIERYRRRESSVEEALTYTDFPFEHWTRIRTNNAIERLNKEIRRRIRVAGNFPDGNFALMLVCARLRHVAGTQWGNKKYMNMKHLDTAGFIPEDIAGQLYLTGTCKPICEKILTLPFCPEAAGLGSNPTSIFAAPAGRQK